MGEEIKKKRSTTGNGIIVGLLSVWWYRFLILLLVYEDDQTLSNKLHRKHPQWLFDLCSPLEQQHHKGPHTIRFTQLSFSLFSIFSWFQMKMRVLVAFFNHIIQKIQMKKKKRIFVLTVHEDFHTGCQYCICLKCFKRKANSFHFCLSKQFFPWS